MNSSTSKSKYPNRAQQEPSGHFFRSGLMLTKYNDAISSIEGSVDQLQITKNELTVTHEAARGRTRLPKECLRHYCILAILRPGFLWAIESIR